MDNTKQYFESDQVELALNIAYKHGLSCTGMDGKVRRKILSQIKAYQHPVPDASQPAGTETYLIYNNDKVNSMLSVALKNLDNEQLEVLRDCLIERTPQPAGNGWLEQINDIMWNSYCIKDKSFGRAEGEKIMQILNDWAKTTS